MTRLDENRAKSQLALKAGVAVSQVSHTAIWGNHSSTQYPNAYHAKINGQSAAEVINDEAWLQGEFLSQVQQRGAAIIKARGLSSAASAANAAIDTLSSILQPTPLDDWHSIAVVSNGAYGAPEGLVTSYPIRSDGNHWHIVEGLSLDPFSQSKINASLSELEEERDLVRSLIPQ